MGLGLQMEKEGNPGKGLWEQGAVGVFSAGVERRGGRLCRGQEPGAGGASDGSRAWWREEGNMPRSRRGGFGWHGRESEPFSGSTQCVCLPPDGRGQREHRPGSGTVMAKIGLL